MTEDSVLSTAAGASSQGQTGSEASGHGPAMRILVADDSASIRRYVRNRLEELSDATTPLAFAEAGDGREAIQLAGEQDFDVVFLDVEMPRVDGLEACQAIKEISSARVVILSSLTTAADHRSGRDAGCDNYLTKPPNDSDLKVILRLVSINTATRS